MTTTTIKVRKETAKRLAAIGRKGQTYDDIITKILNYIEGKRGFKIAHLSPKK